ncbi:P-loop NTPase family protein [Nocardioides marmoraquaticus]
MPETTSLDGARRILLHGVTGAGKSTLAARLGDTLGIAWTDVDHLNWRPGWTEVDPERFAADVATVVTTDEWILDTAYSRVRPMVLDRAQVVVALDYPRHVVRLRLLRRTARRVLLRERVCHSNVETLRRALGRDSILRWQQQAYPRKREALRRMVAAADGPPVLVLRHPREAERLLASLAP